MQARLAVTLRGITLTGCGGDGSPNGRLAAQGPHGNLYVLSFARGDVRRVVFQYASRDKLPSDARAS